MKSPGVGFLNKSYGEKMEKTNLKLLLTLPAHLWYLGDEPTVVVAAESTNSFDPKLDQLNDDLSWKYRCGSNAFCVKRLPTRHGIFFSSV